MSTFTELTTRIQTLLGSDAHISTTEIQSIIQTRYELLYEMLVWSRSLRDFTISLVATVESGTTDTVTATLDSPTITSAGTPFTSAMSGRQITLDNELQYFFFTYVSSSQGTLTDGEGNSVNWPHATASGQGWRIFKTIYTLPTTADRVLSLAGQFPLEEIDGGRTALDDTDPYRLSVNSQPYSWCYAGESSGGVREIEIWPVPTTANLLRGQCGRSAPTLVGATVIDISVPLLFYGSMADCAGMLHAKTADIGWSNLQLFYERKAVEIHPNVVMNDRDKISQPQSLQRSKGTTFGVGTDYQVTHQLPGED